MSQRLSSLSSCIADNCEILQLFFIIMLDVKTAVQLCFFQLGKTAKRSHHSSQVIHSFLYILYKTQPPELELALRSAVLSPNFFIIFFD